LLFSFSLLFAGAETHDDIDLHAFSAGRPTMPQMTPPHMHSQPGDSQTASAGAIISVVAVGQIVIGLLLASFDHSWIAETVTQAGVWELLAGLLLIYFRESK
jgi:hypothetical protein